MNTKYLSAVVCAILMFAFSSCGSSKEFRTLKGEKDIDVVHIPRSVGFIAGTASLFSGDSGTASLLVGFKSLDIVSCEKKGDRAKVYDAVEEALKADRSELIIEVTEGKEKTMIYGRPDDRKKKIKDVTIITDEPGDLCVIRAKGSFNIGSFLKNKLKKSGNKDD